jgi:hypothetical protein
MHEIGAQGIAASEAVDVVQHLLKEGEYRDALLATALASSLLVASILVVIYILVMISLVVILCLLVTISLLVSIP